jgi:AcrR family transcriptional regulator
MIKQDKRDEIIRAAKELIAEHGFHGAPMAMIAEHAKVGAGTIYRYFENKDILISELYKDLEESMFPLIRAGYEADKPLRERFIHLGTGLLRYFIENPLDFRYLEQFHNSPYGVEHRRDKLLGEKEGCNEFRDLFEEGVSRKMIKDFPLVLLFALSFGPLVSAARDHVLGFVTLDDVLITRIIEACWDGIKK